MDPVTHRLSKQEQEETLLNLELDREYVIKKIKLAFTPNLERRILRTEVVLGYLASLDEVIVIFRRDRVLGG
jgi:hypothetical protein